MAGRKPDYRLAAMNKATDEKNGNVGAGWTNPDGSISVVLQPFVAVQHDKNLVLTLFPQKADV